MRGRSFTNPGIADITIPAGPGVSFDLFRGSDSTSATVTFGPGVYSVNDIVAGINGSLAAWSAPSFAYASPVGGGALTLVDKKPVGDASIEVRLDLASTSAREAAAAFTGFSWGVRSTANTSKTTQFMMDREFSGYLFKGDVSDEYLIPAGSDSISILSRVSTRQGVSPVMLLFWSDGATPYNGGTPTFVLPTTTTVPDIYSIFDFGLQEFEMTPVKEVESGAYPLEDASSFILFPFKSMPGYYIDPAPPNSISEIWVNSSLTLVPPPGMTRLRVGFVMSSVNATDYPTPALSAPGLLSRVQVFAWASRKGDI